MALVLDEQKNVIAALKEDLEKHYANGKHINIHVHTHNLTMRNCIVPEIVDDEELVIVLSHDDFYIEIKVEEVKEFDVQYFGEDDSYYLRLDDMEIYFDFI